MASCSSIAAKSAPPGSAASSSAIWPWFSTRISKSSSSSPSRSFRKLSDPTRGAHISVTRHVPALVVGGGISGLVCAYALRKSGIATQLVEASPRPGGVIHSVTREGFVLELGPQSFSSTCALRELCADLGISNQLLQAPPRAPRYVLIDGELRIVPLSPPALLRSSL